MRNAASLAILAAAVAATTTLLAVHALGEGVEAHPVTRVAATQLGWTGYVTVSIATVAVGLRLLSMFPFGQWGVRVVALAKIVDGARDVWLVAAHPAIDAGAIPEVYPAIVAIGATTVLALLVVRDIPGRRPPTVAESWETASEDGAT